MDTKNCLLYFQDTATRFRLEKLLLDSTQEVFKGKKFEVTTCWHCAQIIIASEPYIILTDSAEFYDLVMSKNPKRGNIFLLSGLAVNAEYILKKLETTLSAL